MGEPAPARIDLLREALRYAALAWFVFPVHYITAEGRCSCGRTCGRPGKHPATQNGWKDASIAESTVREWWTHDSSYNIGIACGPSRLMVVDVDPRNEGDITIAELQVRHGELPKTLTANTGGGGQHYYFDTSGVDAKYRGRVLGQGVELQAHGQYVVAPPSNHVLGTYRWDFGQEKHPVFPPPWLIEEESRRTRYAETSGAPLDCILGVAFSAAGMMGTALGSDRMIVQCPWESDHTSGDRFDSSTVVFGAARGKWGWFYCCHAHCKERLAGLEPTARNTEIMRALPEKAADFARSKIKGAEKELRRVTRSDWERSLVWNDKGEKILATAGNLKLMMDNMPEWAALLAYDESRDDMFWTRQPPEVPGLMRPEPRSGIGESDWIYVAQWFSMNKRVEFQKQTAAEVVHACGKANTHNSLTEYLSSLTWDGKDRMSTWLVDYAGAADTQATRAIGRSWLISACARALDPGCQVDHVLVLEGKQGLGKTSIFRILGGKWYLGNLPRLEDKDARHILSGAWIVEIQELAAMKGQLIERVKSYITEPSDTYRPPYGRDFVRRPRRCVFGATTNESEWSGDHTGARRFWPIQVTQVALEALARDRDQLWAQARDAYLAHESFWLPAEVEGGDGGKGKAIQEELREQQAARTVDDPWHALIEHATAGKNDTSMDSLLNMIGASPDKRTMNDAKRVAGVLARLGFTRRRVRRPDGTRGWAYLRSQVKQPGDPLPEPSTLEAPPADPLGAMPLDEPDEDSNPFVR